MKLKQLLDINITVLAMLSTLYLGVWVCLIGGIVQIMEALRLFPNVPALQFAIGVVRFLSAGIVFLVFFLICLVKSKEMMMWTGILRRWFNGTQPATNRSS